MIKWITESSAHGLTKGAEFKELKCESQDLKAHFNCPRNTL